MEIAFRSALSLAQSIRDKEIGCRELLDHYLGRVARFNPEINAIIATDLDAARARADAADAALARGEVWGPLHGVPMTVKESFDVVGMPTTWGLSELSDNLPQKNALAVDRLLAAGVTIFGKTNVPVLLADWQSFNPIHGTANNPWDLSRSPGGSSGGAAAALAAGLTGLEIGSDIGASIRNPAHYCGVFGHKPTFGIAATNGHALPGIVATTDITVIGPMARSAADLAVALDIIAGPDAIDAAGWRLELPAPRKTRLGEYRVALMLDDPNAEVDGPVQDALQRLADALTAKGVTVDDKVRPGFDTGHLFETYIALLRAATSGRQTAEAFGAALHHARTLPADDRSYFARMNRANTMYHKDWLAFNEARHWLRLRWAEFFRDWDLLLCPAACSAATPHDQEGERYNRTIEVNGRKITTPEQMFWAGLSGVAYLPSTVAPAGLTPGGLPVGVQIVGPQYGDRTCMSFAGLIETEIGGFLPPPGYS